MRRIPFIGSLSSPPPPETRGVDTGTPCLEFQNCTSCHHPEWLHLSRHTFFPQSGHFPRAMETKERYMNRSALRMAFMASYYGAAPALR